MKTCQITIAFLTVPVAACFASEAQSEQTEALAEGNKAFALDLFRQLKANSGNVFFSPYSISTALALTYAGARGETEKQMRDVLHFTNVQEVHSAFGVLQRDLLEAGKQEGIELSIANALWAEQGYPFLPAFLRTATGPYQANINQADFKTAPDAARNQINAWVAQQTRDKIQNILPPGTVDENTRLVLVNAIYFKGLWSIPYDKTRTSNQPFHLSSTNQVNAALMHQTETAGYMENSDFQAVELLYKAGLDMVIFLPRTINGRGKLENNLTLALLSATLRQMSWQKVEVFLPRFKLESTFKLNNTLAKMGMPDAFIWPKADFSGMDGSSDLYISGVYHKSWCEVTEEGTEAAAATVGNVTVGVGAVELPPIFRADHPFVFFILDGIHVVTPKVRRQSEAATALWKRDTPSQRDPALSISERPSPRAIHFGVRELAPAFE
jgi:serpin B